MGHYMQRTEINDEAIISNIIGMTTANIGLVWFMFFSGYGLSLKEPSDNYILKDLCKRLSKVYFPLLFTCIITFVVYAFLPNKYTPDEATSLWISSDIANIQNGNIIAVLPHIFGWLDWYIFCIMIFYTLYYFSYYIAKKIKSKSCNQSIVLAILMLAYFIWAYNTFGPPKAHWYRFIWIFLLGHLVAKQKDLSTTTYLLILLPFMVVSLLESKVMLINYFVGICALFVVSDINNKYSIKKSLLLYCGTISYFFYLSHIRISYHVLTYLSINSVLIWVIATVIISIMLKHLYETISNRFVKLLKHSSNDSQ